jgi:putative glutamine amidotransferase
MNKKPVIGVTSNFENIKALSNVSDEFLFIRSNYLNVIIENGGIPVVINNQMEHSDIDQLVQRLDGILFIGGQDIDTSCYGETCQINYCINISGSGKQFNRSTRDQPNYKRDIFEIALYKSAKKNGLAILGICRGYQLINVAEGGTLYQEIPITDIEHNILADETVPIHKVNITANTLANTIFNSNAIMTCSIHHQGVKTLGNNLIASGFAEDNLIEMIESTNTSQFIFGIQGHPERACKKYTENNLLFKSFIQASINKQS